MGCGLSQWITDAGGNVQVKHMEGEWREKNGSNRVEDGEHGAGGGVEKKQSHLLN